MKWNLFHKASFGLFDSISSEYMPYSGCCFVTAHSDRLRNQMLSDIPRKV